MTDVAEHINAMKKKYDMAVHVEEVQSLIRGDWNGLDLTKHGDLVLEVCVRVVQVAMDKTVLHVHVSRTSMASQHTCMYMYDKVHIILPSR